VAIAALRSAWLATVNVVMGSLVTDEAGRFAANIPPRRTATPKLARED
jgi:hypothetical protein